MTAVLNAAHLELDIPNAITIFSIPQEAVALCEAEMGYVDINFRALYRKLTNRKRSKTDAVKETTFSPVPAVPADLGQIGARSSNRYNNIIDQLERKYTAITNPGLEQSEESHSSGPSSKHTTPDVAEKKRARRKAFSDEYDYSDGFIDDTEAVQQFEDVLEGKKTKTKYDGFFVSCGELQVEPVPKKPKVAKPRPTAPPPAATSSGAEASIAASSAAKEKAPPREKPAWQPKAEVQAALEVFRAAVAANMSKVSRKNPLPLELQDPLLQYENTVMAHHSAKEISQTAGYYESISGALGMEVTAIKIRIVINKLQLRDKAKEERAKVQQIVDKLKAALRAVVILCPISRQPGYRASRKAAVKTESDALDTAEDRGDDAEDGLTQPASEEPASCTPQAEPEPSSSSTGGVPAVALTYKFYCRWTVALRQELFVLEQAVTNWALAENRYREKLTAADKADMEDAQWRGLSVKDEVEMVFQDVAGVFPECCLQGDLAAIKNAMKTERQRVAQLKKKEAAAAAAAAVAAATGTSSGVLPAGAAPAPAPPS